MPKLKAALRPGERIIARTPRLWLPWETLETLLMLALSLAVLWAIGIVGFDQSGIRVLLVPMLYFGLVGLVILAFDLSSVAIVTDQRVIVGGAFDRPVTAIDAASVEAVEASRDSVRVGLTDGEVQVFHYPSRARALGVALAKATGVACAPPPSRREVWAGKLYRLCTVFVMLGLILGLSRWVHFRFEEQIAYFLSLNACLLLPLFGRIPGGWLAITLLRRTLSHQETRRWITTFDRTSPLIGNCQGQGLAWTGRAQLWFAKQLY